MAHAAHRGESRPRPAFTLIEVMVVVAIIALLIAILLPSLAEARRIARAAQCATNLRTAGHGVYYYTQANQGWMPNGGDWANITHTYVQRRRGGEKQEIKFLLCPGDPQPHSAPWSIRVDGRWQRLEYGISYGLNDWAAVRLINVQAARQALTHGYQVSNTGTPLKLMDLARAGEVVLVTDTGNDGIHRLEELYWDFDVAEDGITDVLEVHHKKGNNFLHADMHVDFQKILGSHVWRRNVPRFPWRWIPVNNLKPPDWLPD